MDEASGRTEMRVRSSANRGQVSMRESRGRCKRSTASSQDREPAAVAQEGREVPDVLDAERAGE